MAIELESSARRIITLTSRQRMTMHRLLHREFSRCTTATLNNFERLGWITGLSGGYQLTETGRRIAELSEKAPPSGDLKLDSFDN
jgi:hypothetical protein